VLKTLFTKAVDKSFRKLGFYSIIFRRKDRKDFPSVERLSLYKTDCIFSGKQNANLGDLFYKLMTAEGDPRILQNELPFWKTTRKGFDPRDHVEVAKGWHWLRSFTQDQERADVNISIDKIEDFFIKNEFPNGLAWGVALDVAVRAINLCFIYSLTGNNRLKIHILNHYDYLRKAIWFTRGSMRNNHYLGELVALAIMSKMINADSFLSLRKLVEKEIEQQFYADGVNIEQSVRYHKFSLEFLILANLFLDIQKPVMLKAGEFLMALKKPDGSWPSIGDDDLGCVIRLHDDPLNGDYCSVLSTLAILYNRGDFKTVAGSLAPESCLLIEDARTKWINTKTISPEKSFLFEKGGFQVWRSGWGPKDSYLLFKFGPHKWHAHADLFHIELSVNGHNVLVDSGTYRYNNAPEMRKYFRSTSAHNTVTINDEDQTKQWTTFRWHRSAKVVDWRVQENSGMLFFQAQHDGYRRYGVRHRREVEARHSLKDITIHDFLLGKTSFMIRQFWHFDPSVDLKMKKQNLISILRNGQVIGTLLIESDLTKVIHLKETAFSKFYGELSTNSTVEVEVAKTNGKQARITAHFEFF